MRADSMKHSNGNQPLGTHPQRHRLGTEQVQLGVPDQGAGQDEDPEGWGQMCG